MINSLARSANYIWLINKAHKSEIEKQKCDVANEIKHKERVYDIHLKKLKHHRYN